MSRKRKRKAFTLIELLVVVAIIALLISILLPSLSRARELSKRLVCQSNVKGQGTAFKIYANDNEENWPTPTFLEAGTWDIQYTPDGTLDVGLPINLGSADRPGVMAISTNAANKLTTTRALFMLVRSGDVTPKQFICPSSGDTVDPQQNIDLYYDFSKYKNVSYGYQVPYGPFSTRPSEALDPRMCVGADKGPWGEVSSTTASPNVDPNFDGTKASGGLTPQEWKTYNSGNHGGRGTGEGQNVLYADGHASFEKTPIVGVDQDNIYTHMQSLQNVSAGDTAAVNEAVMGGDTPLSDHWYPGEKVWGTTDSSYSTTDSLIYP